jgi:hypothetical protein
MRNGLRVAALTIALSFLVPGISRGAVPATRRPQLPPKTPVITAAQAKHIVAYYRNQQRKLFVYNSEALASGIQRGVYKPAGSLGGNRAAAVEMATRGSEFRCSRRG